MSKTASRKERIKYLQLAVSVSVIQARWRGGVVRKQKMLETIKKDLQLSPVHISDTSKNNKLSEIAYNLLFPLRDFPGEIRKMIAEGLDVSAIDEVLVIYIHIYDILYT